MTDLLPAAQRLMDDSYESDLTEEESERLLLMSEHAIAPPLSPAAQAVLDAVPPYPIHEAAIAAALRAAADQVVPEGYTQAYDCCLGIMAEIREDLLAIAAELEGASG